jgi:hypothetical protein
VVTKRDTSSYGTNGSKLVIPDDEGEEGGAIFDLNDIFPMMDCGPGESHYNQHHILACARIHVRETFLTHKHKDKHMLTNTHQSRLLYVIPRARMHSH